MGGWTDFLKLGIDWIDKVSGGALVNQLLEQAGIDLELPSLQDMAFAIAQMIASMLAPFFAYIMILFIIGMVIYRFPDIVKPFIEKIAARWFLEW